MFIPSTPRALHNHCLLTFFPHFPVLSVSENWKDIMNCFLRFPSSVFICTLFKDPIPFHRTLNGYVPFIDFFFPIHVLNHPHSPFLLVLSKFPPV